MSELKVTSPAFAEGRTIPKRNSGEGEDLSLPLNISKVPSNAEELAVVVDDPDAPSAEPWTHWLIYGISPEVNELPEGIAAQPSLDSPVKARQGKNSWGTVGYRGPLPPKGHGVHHYHIKVYALDSHLDLPPLLGRQQLLQAIKKHIVAETELVGIYQR